MDPDIKTNLGLLVLNKNWLTVWFHQNHLQRKRCRRPEVFCKTGVLRNFSKFTGKNLCHSIFFNKVARIPSEGRLSAPKSL